MKAGTKYIRPFDGMRGVGALMIILYHWPGSYLSISHGWEFMQMFFVMSGYLITLVLLEDKEDNTFGRFALHFYIKRMLRLFPLYFAYLLFWVLVYICFRHSYLLYNASQEIVQHAGYLFTYTFNYMSFINFLTGKEYHTYLLTTHLWTLSVEEQFYLVFPFLVFFLNKDTLKKVVLAAIIIAPIFRILFFFYLKELNPNEVAWVSQNLVRIPFSQMDSIAIGSALALFGADYLRHPQRIFFIVSAILAAAYAINMGYVYFVEGTDYYAITFGKRLAENWITHNYLFTYLITLVNIWCMLALLCVVRGHTFSLLLENRFLVFLGKLSYGVYIVHLPLMLLFFSAVKKLRAEAAFSGHFLQESLGFVLYMALLIGVTYLSFTYFESYFIRLKKKWDKRPVHG